MGKYLVTGGAGFIGSNIAHALVERGDTVRILDDFSSGREENIADLVASGKAELFRGDLCDDEMLARAVPGVDYIFHEAAIPSVPYSFDNPIGADLANAHGTVKLLWAAKRAGVKRLVYAASAAAYGEQSPTLAKVETMLPDPLSPYAAAKLAGEHYLKVFNDSMGLPTVALRYFNIFGPRQDPKSQYAAVIPLFINAAFSGRPATIFGDGEQSRDFCYVDNVVEANLLACTAEGAPGQVFNVACGESTSLLQLNSAIGDIVGKKIPPKHEAARIGDIRYSFADISKSKKILGYTGRVKVRAGLERTVGWFKKNAPAG